jgi:hypothetical protein
MKPAVFMTGGVTGCMFACSIFICSSIYSRDIPLNEFNS